MIITTWSMCKVKKMWPKFICSPDFWQTSIFISGLPIQHLLNK